jgi:hypothetical protein
MINKNKQNVSGTKKLNTLLLRENVTRMQKEKWEEKKREDEKIRKGERRNGKKEMEIE